jgi:UDP-glucose 4-epimerase
MVKAIDMGGFYRIPADTRDLNYNKYFTEGTEAVSQIEEYHSHNSRRLNLDETKELLLSLRFIRKDVLDENPERVYEP